MEATTSMSGADILKITIAVIVIGIIYIVAQVIKSKKNKAENEKK
jgi:hypothetical protein